MSAVVRRILGVACVLGLLLSACGESDSTDQDAAAVITRGGAATRNSGPFQFEQVLRVTLADGEFLAQRTVGIFDEDRVSLEVTSEGTAAGVFSAASTVDAGSILRIVIADEVLLRVDLLTDTGDGPWTVGPEGPSAEGSVSILGSALVANVAEAEVIGEPGGETIAGLSVTQYRAPAPAAEMAIYLPSEMLDLLAEAGLRRDRTTAMTEVDYWVSDDGRLVRVEIDHLPVLEVVGLDLFSTPSEITELRHTFEVLQFGGVEVEVPDSSQIDRSER